MKEIVLRNLTFDIPHPSGHELLVKVQSISVNPVDTKQRTMPVDKVPRVLGFDAVGVIEKIGDQVSMFQEGDVVFIQVLLTKMVRMKNTN